MNLENILNNNNITYGFNSLSQDEFCTVVLILLGTICLFFICAVCLLHEIKKNTADSADLIKKSEKRLKDVNSQLCEISITTIGIHRIMKQNPKDR